MKELDGPYLAFSFRHLVPNILLLPFLCLFGPNVRERDVETGILAYVSATQLVTARDVRHNDKKGKDPSRAVE